MALKRKYLKHGDLLEFDLRPYFKLYGYGKFIDFKKEGIDLSYNMKINFFNYFSKNPISDYSVLNEIDLLTNPFIISRDGKILSNWKILKNSKVNEGDLIRTFYKEVRGNLTLRLRPQVEKFENYYWGYLNDDEVGLRIHAAKDYKSVQHLEFSYANNKNKVIPRLCIEYSKLINYQFSFIDEYKKLSEEGYFSKVVFEKLKPDPEILGKINFFYAYVGAYGIPNFNNLEEKYWFKPLELVNN